MPRVLGQSEVSFGRGAPGSKTSSKTGGFTVPSNPLVTLRSLEEGSGVVTVYQSACFITGVEVVEWERVFPVWVPVYQNRAEWD